MPVKLTSYICHRALLEGANSSETAWQLFNGSYRKDATV